MSDYNVYLTNGDGIIKAWTKGVQVEDQALDQMRNVASLPFIFKHVAAMPDVHWGMGTTVGTILATKGAIVPAAVGVDIGCGMVAALTNLTANQLPDNLYGVRLNIEAAVPHGRTNDGGKGDRGAWHDVPEAVAHIWPILGERYAKIVDKHPSIKRARTIEHLGTLGTGNHFIELCLDEQDRVWVMLHSGSRGVGNRIGTYFIEKAKEEMRRWYIDRHLPDQDLAYLVENTEVFDDYVEAVSWAQDFAYENRMLMLDATVEALRKTFRDVTYGHAIVSCHHNYISREHHFGQNVFVTRKGAVRARVDDLGIIPGSMGTGSFIVRGKGNPESFHSCSHGAGRSMSRGAAKKAISLEQHAAAMTGIEGRLDEGVLDESPAAYKDISTVMAAQDSLVDIVHRLHQVVNVKG